MHAPREVNNDRSFRGDSMFWLDNDKGNIQINDSIGRHSLKQRRWFDQVERYTMHKANYSFLIRRRFLHWQHPSIVQLMLNNISDVTWSMWRTYGHRFQVSGLKIRSHLYAECEFLALPTHELLKSPLLQTGMTCHILGLFYQHSH